MNEPFTNRLDVLEHFVGGRAARLQNGYLADQPGATATLARLRRALPSAGQFDPDAWDILADMPAALIGHGDDPSRAEVAAVSALSLFAIHQQSRRDAGMHRHGSADRPGRAFGHLHRATSPPGVDRQTGVNRRFRALTRSADLTAALQHLRGLVTQLRTERIPLDYGVLGRDLYQLQQPSTIYAVRMRWARDFHRAAPNDAERGVTETGVPQ